MALHYLFVIFFFSAFLVALYRLLFLQDITIFPALVESTFESAKTGFEISLFLTGVLCLWLGIMKIGERGGVVDYMAKATAPFFKHIFPEIPKGHPVFGPMLMNFSANMLGLDNAATPLGLKTMEGLQELNQEKSTASNAQIMFLVLNTSGLTVIPVSVMVYRSQMGAADPTDIFLPILLATFFSTLVGLLVTAAYQRLNLFKKQPLMVLGGATLFVIAMIVLFTKLDQSQVSMISSVVSNFLLFGIIILFLLMAVRKKANVYDAFIEGAKGGFDVAIKIIPYLIAILVAIGVFRTSGVMDYLLLSLEWMLGLFGFDLSFIPALPTALIKPLSGSGARGLMIETMSTYGADSFAGRLASIMQGSTETTFYVLAVYFGSVNIRKTRYALTCGLIADAAGIIAAIFLAYLFFF
ncbi:MAG: hypothetical protein LAT68_02560 [Cyclobacteriaceae bacterium]|nr:hypothetical protein [Cyclobacteriaceae bacterium]MCH8515186.1 hypothetical protein [Cyclobacteriaceae bacterium]